MDKKQRGIIKRAFTLIELIVVMAVIAILVLLAAPKFLGYTQKAEETKHIHTAKVLETALDAYLINGGEIGTGLTVVDNAMLNESATNKNLINTKGYIVSVDTNTYYELTDNFIKANLDIKLSASRSIPFIIEAHAANSSKAPNAVYATSDGAVIINKEQTLKGYEVINGDVESPVDVAPEDISQLASGGHHSVALKKDGTVWAWGFNSAGQLGLGDIVNRNTPQEITFLRDKNIQSIATGIYHTLALSTDGRVWAWGMNDHGQLGLGDKTNRNVPQEIIVLRDKNIQSIVSENYHTQALSVDGTVWAWGNNSSGELGLGDTISRDVPQEVITLRDKNIQSVSVGAIHSLALSVDGRVWAWGNNSNGCLGLGDIISRNVPQEVVMFRDKNIQSLMAVGYLSLAQSADGTVWTWGDNSYGQLGLGDIVNQNTPQEITFLKDKNIQSIAGTTSHTLALSADGTVWAWGRNNYGQLGLGDTVNRNTPQEITALRDENIQSIAGGNYHALALSADGALWGWGLNFQGQLGLGDNTNRNTPVAIPNITLN